MTSNRKKIIAIILGLALAAAFLLLRSRKGSDQTTVTRTFTPRYETIRSVIATTGTVQPYNRVEIKPTISGRVEKVQVDEGDRVRTGQILAWMSSQERAALIDAAMTQGPEAVKYWKEAYKPIPITAPISGTVILRAIEPGQTVAPTTTIMALSDYLIVVADVDETDIGRMKPRQDVEISLDAYPEVKTHGRVDTISYDSKVVNNVTMYQVKIVLTTIPPVFRSGMSANINIIEKTKERALVIAAEAIVMQNQRNYVMVRVKGESEPVKREVTTGIVEEQKTEIVAGLKEGETVVVIEKKLLPPEAKSSQNPFMPTKKRR